MHLRSPGTPKTSAPPQAPRPAPPSLPALALLPLSKKPLWPMSVLSGQIQSSAAPGFSLKATRMMGMYSLEAGLPLFGLVLTARGVALQGRENVSAPRSCLGTRHLQRVRGKWWQELVIRVQHIYHPALCRLPSEQVLSLSSPPDVLHQESLPPCCLGVSALLRSVRVQ